MSLHRDWSHSNPFPRQQSSVTQAQSLGTSRGLVTPPLCHTQRVGLSQESLPHPGTNWCHGLCHRSLPSPLLPAAPAFQASPLATSGASSPLLATAGSSAPGSGGSTEPWGWCGRGTRSELSSGEGQHKIRKGFMGFRLEQPQTSRRQGLRCILPAQDRCCPQEWSRNTHPDSRGLQRGAPTLLLQLQVGVVLGLVLATVRLHLRGLGRKEAKGGSEEGTASGRTHQPCPNSTGSHSQG